MGRQILVDQSSVEESSQVTDTSEFGATSATTPTSVITGEASVIITHDEMDKLFHEWDALGQNDLFINPSLADRIKQYLAYQEELDPLKTQLAQRIYKPYLVTPESTNDYKTFDINVNGINAVRAACYVLSGTCKVINVSAFKAVLMALKNPYAPYVPNSTNQYVDFLTYVLANGGTWEFGNGHYNIVL